MIRVHVRTYNGKGSARAYLHRADGSYTMMCTAPCTVDVPANSELRVTLNDNDEEPHTFTIPSDQGPEVDLEVRPASVAPLVGGIVMMGSGGAFILSGLLFVAVADLGESSGSAFTRSSTEGYEVAGYVCIGLGAAAAVGGLVWLLTRSKEPRVQGWPHRPDGYGRSGALPLRLGFTF